MRLTLLALALLGSLHCRPALAQLPATGERISQPRAEKVRRRPIFKRLMAATLAASIAVTSLGGCSAPWSYSQPEKITNACQVFDQKLDWYKSAKEAQKEFRNPKTGKMLPISSALGLAFGESSLDPYARPPREWTWSFPFYQRPTTAVGLGQFTNATWQMYEKAIGESANRENPKDAMRAIFWHAKYLSDQVGRDLRQDTKALTNAHWAGAGGYAQGARNHSHAANVSRAAAKYERQLKGCQADLDQQIKPLLERLYDGLKANTVDKIF